MVLIHFSYVICKQSGNILASNLEKFWEIWLETIWLQLKVDHMIIFSNWVLRQKSVIRYLFSFYVNIIAYGIYLFIYTFWYNQFEFVQILQKNAVVC